MAIDDNTLYGLTGAQVKELPERIEAVKGLARELTAEDYNANSSNWADTDPTNFDCIAAWKLDSGLYRTPTNVRVYVTNSSRIPSANNGKDACLFAVSRFVQYNVSYAEIMVLGSYYAYPYTSYYPIWRTQISNGNGSKSWEGLMVSNSLTNNSAGYVLDARQGKVLKDLIDSIAIRRAGAPTTSTVGQVGTLYEDTTNGDLYICTDATNPYVWEEVGTGGGGGPTVVQTTGTSTTDVMSQIATSQMIYPSGYETSKNRIAIGAGATSDSDGSVVIGPQARGGTRSTNDVVIGAAASAYNGNHNVAIGAHAYTFSNSSYAISVGAYANSSNTYAAPHSIALGDYSKTTQKGQMDISTSASTNTYGYNNSQYRLLTGLYDPQSDHDAATKGYVDNSLLGKQDALTAGSGISIADESGSLVISTTVAEPDEFTSSEWNALWS